jgi:hypothetical protein
MAILCWATKNSLRGTSWLMQVCVGFNNVTGEYLVQVSLLLIGQQGLGHFFRILTLASLWLEDCANFTPTPEENYQYSAKYVLLVQYKHASPSTFINVQLYSTCH